MRLKRILEPGDIVVADGVGDAQVDDAALFTDIEPGDGKDRVGHGRIAYADEVGAVPLEVGENRQRPEVREAAIAETVVVAPQRRQRHVAETGDGLREAA